MNTLSKVLSNILALLSTVAIMSTIVWFLFSFTHFDITWWECSAVFMSVTYGFRAARLGWSGI